MILMKEMEITENVVFFSLQQKSILFSNKMSIEKHWFIKTYMYLISPKKKKKKKDLMVNYNFQN